MPGHHRKSEADRTYCPRVRARAIRRAGELLNQIEPQKGGDRKSDQYQSEGDHTLITRESAARDAGMSKHQQMSENIGNRYWWRTSFYRPYERLHVLL